MLLLRHDAIQSAIASVDLLDELEHALSRPGKDAPDLPPRLTMTDKQGGFLRVMSAFAYDIGYAGFKAMNMHPEQGVRYTISLISLATGELVALLDADWITAYRTAATAAIAVRHLKPQNAETIAVIGSGTQARALLEAAAPVVKPARVLVFSPTAGNRERFAAEASAELGLAATPVDTATAAVREADVVLSAFRAKTEPVVRLADVRPGALVCGISSVRPHHREVETALWHASRVVVDDLPHVLESGDGRAAAEGADAAQLDIPELWRVLQDSSLGRRSAEQRMLFKSVGTAEQDIALAALVVAHAKARGIGEDLGDFPALRPIQSATDKATIWRPGAAT